jgi:hypothetical protein
MVISYENKRIYESTNLRMDWFVPPPELAEGGAAFDGFQAAG